MKSQGQRRNGFKWIRPEGVSPHSPLPKMRWSVDDPEMDVMSDKQRLVYEYLNKKLVWTTDRKLLSDLVRGQGYADIAAGTGMDPKTVQRAIYALIWKCMLAAWDDAKEAEIPLPPVAEGDAYLEQLKKSPTGRTRGDCCGSLRRPTTYRVLPKAEALARREARYRHWFELNRKGELKPRWLTIGVGRRIITGVEFDGPPKGWNTSEFIEHRKESGQRRAEREERRNAREVGQPPECAAEAPLPEPPGETSVEARANVEATEPIVSAPRGDPPKPVWVAVTKYCAANKGNVWEIVDVASQAAASLGGIEAEEIADFVHECARLASKKEVSVYRYFLKAVPDRIRQDPPYKRRPRIERSEQTGRPRCRQEF